MSKSFLNQSGLPLGLRNNNPGNLRPGIDWQGAIGENAGFLVFENIAYGIRAMATDIGNDIRLDGLNTIRKLINEYAPPTENNTEAYIQSMVTYTGFSADQVLPASESTLLKLIRAHMNVELGASYSKLVTDADILEGLSMISKGLKDYFSVEGSGTNNSGIVVGIIAAIGIGLFFWSK